MISFYSVPKLRCGPLILNIKTFTLSRKNHSSVTILIICVYAFNRNKHFILYIPSTFQTSDIELLSPKINTEYTSH